jgi:hypothetical protein
VNVPCEVPALATGRPEEITPKHFAVVAEVSAAGIGLFANRLFGGQRRLATLEGENQRVNGNGFCQSHPEDGNCQNAPEGAWVSSYSLSCFRSDKPNTNAGPESRHTERKTSSTPPNAASARIGRFMM